MQYVFDGIIIVALVIFTVIGAKKGFIKAAADLMGGLISMIAAGMLSSHVAEYIYSKLFAEAVELKVKEALEIKGMELAEYFESLPEFVARWLDFTGINAETIGEKMLTDAGTSAAEAVTQTLAPVFIGLINVFVVIILFLLFMIIIKAIANFLTGLFHLPLLKEVNGILGAVLGLMLGALVLWIFIGAVEFFQPMMEMESQ